jgi:hypothetical protein
MPQCTPTQHNNTKKEKMLKICIDTKQEQFNGKIGLVLEYIKINIFKINHLKIFYNYIFKLFPNYL